MAKDVSKRGAKVEVGWREQEETQGAAEDIDVVVEELGANLRENCGSALTARVESDSNDLIGGFTAPSSHSDSWTHEVKACGLAALLICNKHVL